MFERAKTADRSEILAMYRAAGDVGRQNGSSDWNEHYPSPEFLAEDLDRGELYVIREAGKIVAAASLMKTDDLDGLPLGWTPSNSCVPARICVSPDLQGRGMGMTLMKQVHLTARALGYESARLLCSHQNHAARRLYEKLGYKLVCADVFLYDTHFFAFEYLFEPVRALPSETAFPATPTRV